MQYPMSMIQSSIKLKNYKCFGNSPNGFEKICPVNIIIGKNNSGKSSLLDLIKMLANQNPSFFDPQEDGVIPEVIVTSKFTQEDIDFAFHSNTSGGLPGSNHYIFGKDYIGRTFSYALKSKAKQLLEIEGGFIPQSKIYFDKIISSIKLELENKSIRSITAERDVFPELYNQQISISENGTGATNYVQQIITNTLFDGKLIEKTLLGELNNIVRPDIEFSDIITRVNSTTQKWEIYLENKKGQRVALSKMGSGVKTILLVLLNLLTVPAIENRPKNDFIFLFEELENNLHPSLQRRLFEYIKQYAKKHSCYFFITTHSNVVIDAFGNYEDSQILHITNQNDESKISTLLSKKSVKQVLDDLDVRASDILQSNGIIWVEGPSDRNYINHWLGLIAPNLQEGTHYSIMYYGGRTLANLCFDYDWLNTELIPLLRLNTNAFVVIDKDGKKASSNLNNTKIRIQDEIGENNCWVTKGREIENYLTAKTINSWLSKYINSPNFIYHQHDKIEDTISHANPSLSLKYNTKKREFSSEIISHIDVTDLKILDLDDRIHQMVNVIKKWNSIQ